MNRFFLVICCFLLSTLAYSQNCSLDAPVPIPFSDTVKIDLDVFDVVNDDLSDPGQAVCSVDINFNCNEIAGLEMWLVSPGGDTVQLAGPVVNTGTAGTLASNWDITFLNDNLTPTAEPDFPFDERFDNQINLFSGGNYTGSYFPFLGSLQSFNSGPVNGQWQLILHLTPNFSLVDGSQVNDIHINFCDRRGYFCCFSEAGQFADLTPVTACQGAASLSTVDLGIDFPGGTADSAVYDYTYVVTQGGRIVTFDSLPELGNYPPGNYELTGFSYQSNQRDSFPPIDTTFLLDTLRSRLISDLPPFCGSFTVGSKSVTVLPQPDTTFLGNQTICEGDSLLIGGQVLDSAGLYTIQTLAVNGCDSIIQLSLLLQQPMRDTILETTCSSGPFLSSTGETLDTSGFYTFSYPLPSGCDSVVVVDFRRYNIRVDISASATDLSCRDSVIILDGTGSTTGYGTFSYRWEAPPFGAVISTDSVVQINSPGNYTLQLLHNEGLCPPIQTSIQIGENIMAPVAAADPAPNLTCTRSQIRLSSQAVSGSGAYSYAWTSPEGNMIADSMTLSPLVDRAGNYGFILTDEINGCRDTASVQVAIDTLLPEVSIQGDSVLTCLVSTTELLATTSVPGNYSFEWFDSQGVALPGGNTDRLTVSTVDTFEVLVSNLDNGCFSSAFFITRVDTVSPVAMISVPAILNCQVREIELDASSSQTPVDVEAVWTAANGGNIVAGIDSLIPRVNASGQYSLLLTNQRNGCTDSADVLVQDTTQALIAAIVQEDTLTCDFQQTTLRPTGSSSGANIQYIWTDLDHGTFSGAVAAEVSIALPGRYQLLVQDTFSKCLEVTTFTTLVDTLTPVAMAGASVQLDCSTSEVLLGDPAALPSPRLQYSWQGPCLLSPADSIQMRVNCQGLYLLTLVDQQNGCSSVDSVQVTRDATVPTAVVVDSVEIDCSTGLAFIDGSLSFGGTLEWYFEGASLNTFEDSLLVVNPGRYTLRVVNSALQCEDERDIMVTSDCKPTAIINPPDSLTCTRFEVLLDATNSEGEALSYTWNGPGGANCFVGEDSITAIVAVSCPGTYQLIVRNTVVNESDTTTVQVLDNIDFPLADAGADIDLTCERPIILRDAFNPANPTGVDYRWNTSFGLTLSNQPDFSFDTGGTYVLEVENSTNSCISRDTVLVTEPDVPNFEIRVPEVLNCADSLVLLDPLFFTNEDHLTFQWEGLEGQLVNQANLRTVEVSEAGFYRLTAQDTTTMCSFSDTIRVELDRSLPEVNAGMDTVLGCTISTLTLKGEVEDESRSLEYLWLSAQTSDIVNGGNSLRPVVQDTGVYQLVVLDLMNGCVASDTIAVLPPPALPDISDLSDTTLNCSVKSINLVSPIQDTAAYDLIWTGFTDAGTGIDSVPASIFLAEATGSYTLTIRDKITGCEGNRTIRVDIDTLAPEFTISSPDLLTCTTTEVLLTMVDSLEAMQFDFSWTDTENNTVSTEQGWLTNTPGEYSLQVTNKNNGCTSSKSIIVIEDLDLPGLSLAIPEAITCIQDTVRISAISDSSTRPQWFGPVGGITGADDQFDVDVIQPGLYVIEVMDTLTGCAVRDSLQVIEDRAAPILTIDTSGLIIGCLQTSVEIDASTVQTSSGQAAIYQWSGIGIASDQARLVVEEPQVLSLQLTDPQNGCLADYSIEVQQDQEQPRFSLQSDGTLGCGKEDVLIVANFMPESAGYELEWFSGTEMLSQGQATISVRDTGTYRLLATNPANGCTFEQNIQIDFNAAIPQINIDADTVLDCNIDQVALQVQSSNYNVGELTFQWSTFDGELAGSNNTSSVLAMEQGTYTVEVNHAPSNCRSTASSLVLRRGRRVEGVDFTITPDNCDTDGGGTLLISNVEGGDGPYLFSFNGSGFSDSEQIFIESAGTYALEVEDINGCRWDTLLSLSLEELPIVNFGADLTITEGDSIRLEVSVENDNYDALNWINNNTVIASGITELTVKPPQSTVYKVQATTTAGCLFEDQIWIFVEEGAIAYQPTAFSPNDDGINDLFIPAFTDQVSTIRQFNIFDRWGNIVHTIRNAMPDDLNAAWNGERNNRPLASGVYIYWVEVELENGELRMLEGEVLLVR